MVMPGIGGAEHRRGRSRPPRMRAWWACWAGPIEPSNQASLVILRMNCGLGDRIAEIAGEDRLVADEREERRRARRRHQPAAVAGRPAIGAGHELADAERASRNSCERQVLAERHEMRLVVARDDLAIGVDGEDRVVARVVRRSAAPSSSSGSRGAPVSSVTPSGSMRRDARQRLGIVREEEREAPIPARPDG